MLAIDCVTVPARPAADRARDAALFWAAIVVPQPAGSASCQAARTAAGSADSHVPGAAAGWTRRHDCPAVRLNTPLAALSWNPI
jgi:hypothetical protein